MSAEQNLPTRQAVRATLAALGLAGDPRVSALPGSYSNFTHLVELVGAEPRKIVLRRYNPEYLIDGHDKHRCEYHALRLLQEHEYAGASAPAAG